MMELLKVLSERGFRSLRSNITLYLVLRSMYILLDSERQPNFEPLKVYAVHNKYVVYKVPCGQWTPQAHLTHAQAFQGWGRHPWISDKDQGIDR